MCGIAGYVNRDASRPADAALVRTITDTITHRGPDEDGYLAPAYVEWMMGCPEGWTE